MARGEKIVIGFVFGCLLTCHVGWVVSVDEVVVGIDVLFDEVVVFDVWLVLRLEGIY